MFKKRARIQRSASSTQAKCLVKRMRPSVRSSRAMIWPLLSIYAPAPAKATCLSNSASRSLSSVVFFGSGKVGGVSSSKAARNSTSKSEARKSLNESSLPQSKQVKQHLGAKEVLRMDGSNVDQGWTTCVPRVDQ